MNFEEFQSESRLYVIGALEPEDVEEFERERKKVWQKSGTLHYTVLRLT
jgi:hypothetical protein